MKHKLATLMFIALPATVVAQEEVELTTALNSGNNESVDVRVEQEIEFLDGFAGVRFQVTAEYEGKYLFGLGKKIGPYFGFVEYEQNLNDDIGNVALGLQVKKEIDIYSLGLQLRKELGREHNINLGITLGKKF
jgi:hypothetical protein